MPAPRYVLVGNPGSKRLELYRRELTAYWAGRGESPEVGVVPWADVAPADGNLDALAAFDRPAVVRLESPGKDAAVYRLMLEAGARDDPSEPPRDWRALPVRKGELLRPGLWYRGFRRVLRGLRRSFDARPHLRPTACPLAVAEMFDKAATARRLHAAGVPVPETLGPDELPATGIRLYYELHGRWPLAYVKLNTGSSANAVVAVRYSGGDSGVGRTTAHLDGAAYRSSRRLRDVQNVGLAHLLGFLLREGAVAQRGVEMAQVDGDNFDVRVVCVHGRPAAHIFRVSPHPMTNLHLGGRRGDPDRCRAAVPRRAWLDGLDACEAAARLYPSAVAGVDLLFERGTGRPTILEVNAFGDFFPGWVDAAGRSIHRLEIAATAERSGA